MLTEVTPRSSQGFQSTALQTDRHTDRMRRNKLERHIIMFAGGKYYYRFFYSKRGAMNFEVKCLTATQRNTSDHDYAVSQAKGVRQILVLPSGEYKRTNLLQSPTVNE